MKPFILLATAFLMLSATLATARSDSMAAQRVIEQQLQAFRVDDGNAAYGFAAPNIRKLYPTREQFMAMVRQGYQPVYRPQHFSFGRWKEIGPGSLAQEVLITGPSGKNWVALYTLERQPDGRYAITGVSLQAAPDLST